MGTSTDVTSGALAVNEMRLTAASNASSSPGAGTVATNNKSSGDKATPNSAFDGVSSVEPSWVAGVSIRDVERRPSVVDRSPTNVVPIVGISVPVLDTRGRMIGGSFIDHSYVALYFGIFYRTVVMQCKIANNEM